MNAGETKTFDVQFPAEYTVKELAGTTVTYKVTVKEIRHRVLPELDDEFAKDVGAFESLAALRDRVRADLQEEAADNTTRSLRGDLLQQLAKRLSFDPPASLVDREMDRRVEEFARQLMQQNMDPRQAGHRLGSVPRSAAGAGDGLGGERAGARRDRAARASDGLARRGR